MKNSKIKVKVAIIGGGNISNTRHIPALRKMKNVEIVGVIGIKKTNVERTQKRYDIPQSLILNNGAYVENMKDCEWFNAVDAVVIGAPPKEHFALVEAALRNNKHVLVEKPMTMNVIEADKLMHLSKERNKIFCVMHNFQYASGMRKLDGILKTNILGKTVSFFEVQFTNKNRRLPEWYNDLPLGLFYDEAPHFIYLLEKYGGDIVVENAYAQFSKDKNENTPITMNVSMMAGKYPVNLLLNFESPVCEWYFIVCGENKIAYYDLFKDILVVLPSDNEHFAKDILSNSLKFTFQYWFGFVKNGIRMMSGNLLYGHDEVMKRYIESVIKNEYIDDGISCERGKTTVGYMNDIVERINQSRNI